MANTKKYVSLDKLALYDEKIKKVISDGDAASLASAKGYVDEKIATCDPKGSAAAVQGKLDEEVIRAKAREDEIAGLVATAQGEVDALEEVVATKAAQADLEALSGKVGTVPEGSTVMGIIKNIQENAYDDTEIRGIIDTKVDKTQYATDKAGLEGAIALKADQTALQGEIDRATGEEARIEGLVTAEAERAAGEEARIEGLVTAEAERAAGVEESLQNQINTIMSNPDAEGAINSINEFTQYVTEHGTIAEGMRTDINKNKEDIAAHVALDHDFAAADTALKNELNGEIAKKADTTYVNEELAKKADTTYVNEELAKKADVTALEAAVEALEGADAGQVERIVALEAKFGTGEGNVESQIEAAKQAAISAAAEDATTKANKALEDAKKYADDEDAKIESRVDALETASATHALKTEVEAVDGRVEALEGVVSTKASQESLNGVADRVTAIETWHSNFVEVSEEEINALFA